MDFKIFELPLFLLSNYGGLYDYDYRPDGTSMLTTGSVLCINVDIMLAKSGLVGPLKLKPNRASMIKL